MKDFKTCMRGLNGMIRPVRKSIALSFVLGALRIAASLSFVWVCKTLVDIATGVDDHSLGTYMWLMIGIMLFQIVVNAAANWWNGYIITRNQNSMRESVFSHVMNSEWNGREAFHSGDTVNRLEQDISIVVDLVCTRIPDVLITVVQFIAASIFLFTMEPSLLWVLLILMPAAVIGSKMFFKTIRALTAKIRAKDSEVQGFLQESLQHRLLVKTLGRTEKTLEKLGWLQTDMMSNTIKRLNYNAIARSFMQFGFTAGYAAAFLWGVFGIRDGAVTYGMMTAFLQLVGQVQRPIADISRHIPAFIHGLTSVERILELDELPLEQDGDEIMLEGAPGVAVEHISFAYSDKEDAGREPVFTDFSHDFRPGSVTALMGVTGSGKSSLSRILLGLLKPSEGAVYLYTNDGQRIPVGPSVRCNFMYVPQGNSLMSGTLRENLLFANPDATDEQMAEALHAAVADFVLSLPEGLDTVCSEKGSGLSEGQAQRIAIARALLHTGGILILDEATSAIDSDTERELLKRLSSSTVGKTIIWITHREAVTGISTDILKLD